MQLIQKYGPPKIGLRAVGTHESHPTAWEVSFNWSALDKANHARYISFYKYNETKKYA